MKKLIIAGFFLLSIGANGMINERIKKNLFEDAQLVIGKDIAGTPVEEVKAAFQELVTTDGFTKEEVVQISKEYAGSFPRNAGNFIDTTFRNIAAIGLEYYDGIQKPQLPSIVVQESWWDQIPMWAKIGGGVLAFSFLFGGGAAFKGRRF